TGPGRWRRPGRSWTGRSRTAAEPAVSVPGRGPRGASGVGRGPGGRIPPVPVGGGTGGGSQGCGRHEQEERDGPRVPACAIRGHRARPSPHGPAALAGVTGRSVPAPPAPRARLPPAAGLVVQGDGAQDVGGGYVGAAL